MSPRLLALTLILSIVGAFLTLRFSVQYARALSRRYRRGVPYLYGSAGRAFFLMVLSLGLLIAGTTLGATGWGLTAYQPFREAVQAGTVQVTSGADRTLSFTLEPGPGYPIGKGNSVTGVPAGNWSVVGRFILWHRSLKWLGLQDAHRVALVLTVPNLEKIPRQESITRVPLDLPGQGRLWKILDSYGRFLPMVETREFQTPWRTGPVTDLQLYASRIGYLLAENTENR